MTLVGWRLAFRWALVVIFVAIITGDCIITIIYFQPTCFLPVNCPRSVACMALERSVTFEFNNNNNNRRLVILAEHTSDHGKQTTASTKEFIIIIMYFTVYLRNPGQLTEVCCMRCVCV